MKKVILLGLFGILFGCDQANDNLTTTKYVGYKISDLGYVCGYKTIEVVDEETGTRTLMIRQFGFVSYPATGGKK